MPHPPSPTEAALTALAQLAGAHALQVFGLLLALLLAGVALLDWSLRRVVRRRREGGTGPLARLITVVVLGFAAVVGAGIVFAAIAERVEAGGALMRVDQVFIDAVQRSTSPAALQVFAAITRLGDPAALALLCVAGGWLLWRRGERLLAAGFVVAIVGNALLNPALKLVFERMRPLGADGQPVADGWSFPSGHSSGTLVAYGMLAYVLMLTLPRGWHLPAVLLAAATAFAVGCSRVFVQAHFASDVVAGFASGLVWLAICVVSVELARRRKLQAPTPAGARR